MTDSKQQQELVRSITEEILGRLKHESLEYLTCGCRTECVNKCPDRLRLLLDCGVSRIGLLHAEPRIGNDLARYIDHTLLKPEATHEQVLQLCREAVQYGFASVCINPSYVRVAAEAVRCSEVLVCS